MSRSVLSSTTMILGPVVLDRQAAVIAGVDSGTAIMASASSAAFFTYIFRILNNNRRQETVHTSKKLKMLKNKTKIFLRLEDSWTSPTVVREVVMVTVTVTEFSDGSCLT